MFRNAIETILDQSEAATRAKIAAIPDGTYEADAFLDNDGVNDARIPIKVKVIVAGDEMTIDYSEWRHRCGAASIPAISAADAPLRASPSSTWSRPTSRRTTAPSVRFNLILPEGTLLSASPTAAMGSTRCRFPTVIDAIIRRWSRRCRIS